MKTELLAKGLGVLAAVAAALGALLNYLARTPLPAATLKPGDGVLVTRKSDGALYPGTIAEIAKRVQLDWPVLAVMYRIQYDDRNVDWVTADHIRCRVGDKVLARREENNLDYPGRITRFTRDGRCHVKFNDGKEGDVLVSDLELLPH